eukprot:tig00001487_g8941.t1
MDISHPPGSAQAQPVGGYLVTHFKELLDWPVTTERSFYDKLLAFWFAMAPVTFVACMCFTAPYGRHYRSGFGPKLSGRFGWFLQEVISPIFFFAAFFMELPIGRGLRMPLSVHMGLPAVFLGMWMIHYVNRSIIHSLMCPSFGPTNVTTVLCAILFNVVNGYLNGRHFSLVQPYPTHYFFDPRFLLGVMFWNVGWLINVLSDYALWALRSKREKEAGRPAAAPEPASGAPAAPKGAARQRGKPAGKAAGEGAGPQGGGEEVLELGGEGEAKRAYLIPRGGAFEYVSCANYFGELLEWTGFAIATWSPAALAFVLLTAANLVPRARAHHAFYRSHFGERYPKNRKAIIPGIY